MNAQADTASAAMLSLAHSFVVDSVNQCATLNFKRGSTPFIIDLADLNRLATCDKKFVFLGPQAQVVEVSEQSPTPPTPEFYPSCMIHTERVNLLEYLHFLQAKQMTKCRFVNGNPADLRKANVVKVHPKQAALEVDYNVLEYFPGHFNTTGTDAFVMKNPRWLLQDKVDGSTKMVMYCEPDTLTQLCPTAYDRILQFQKTHTDDKPLTFYKHSNGYINCRLALYIHQIITGCYGHGKGTATISVDHLDQDPLNNTLANLRIATQEEQRHNTTGLNPDDSTKRKRQCLARPLPDGLTQEELRKYVVYYKECYNKEQDLHREYFKVEHPKLGNKPWISSKSGKISWQDKLASAHKVVDDLERNVMPATAAETRVMPPYVRIETKNGRTNLIYDHKHQTTAENLTVRYNFRMVLKDGYDLQTSVNILFEKLREKYPNEARLFHQ